MSYAETLAQLPEDARSLRELAREHRITWVMVAAEASKTSKRGHVGETLCSHVFADPPRAKSRNVLAAAKRLIARALARELRRQRQQTVAS